MKKSCVSRSLNAALCSFTWTFKKSQTNKFPHQGSTTCWVPFNKIQFKTHSVWPRVTDECNRHELMKIERWTNERRRKRMKHNKRSDYIASASAFRVVQIESGISNRFKQRKNEETKLTTSTSMCNNNIWKCTEQPAFFRHIRPHHVLIIQSWKTINFGYNYYRRFQIREPKQNAVFGEKMALRIMKRTI